MRNSVFSVLIGLFTVLVSCSNTAIAPLSTVGDIRGTKWRLQAFDSPERGRVSVPDNGSEVIRSSPKPVYTIEFDTTGTLYGILWNCNFGGGKFNVQQPNTILMNSRSITLIGCGDYSIDDAMRSSDGRISLWGWLFTGKSCTYNSDENRLRIWYDNNTKSADFARVR
jgi:hypothetical protein